MNNIDTWICKCITTRGFATNRQREHSLSVNVCPDCHMEQPAVSGDTDGAAVAKAILAWVPLAERANVFGALADIGDRLKAKDIRIDELEKELSMCQKYGFTDE